MEEPLKGSTLRVYRLATAVALSSVVSLAAAPVLADSTTITQFSGGGSGSAINVAVSPSAVLNLNLNQVKSIVDSLPLGVGGTVENVAGSTLTNPNADILVAVDQALAAGESKTGTDLTGGNATSTPISLNAQALTSELDFLSGLLHNLPTGTVAALRGALAPIIANDATGQLANALNLIDNTLNNYQVADALGHPDLHFSKSLSVNFPLSQTGSTLTVDPYNTQTITDHVVAGLPGVSGAGFTLDPYLASAMPSGASANNSVTSLRVLGGGANLSVPGISAPTLKLTLDSLLNALQTVENTASGAAASVPVAGPIVVGPLGTVTSTINNNTDAIVKTSQGVPVDLTKVDQLLQQVVSMRNSLGAINGLRLNDILGTGNATANGSLLHVGDQVKADGYSRVVDLEAVTLKNNLIAQPLNQVLSILNGATGGKVPAIDLTNAPLLTVHGITASAAVALDGVHQPNASSSTGAAYYTASGQLAEIDVLRNPATGQSLLSLTQVDSLLPPGTSCVIAIPGKITCPVDIKSTLGVDVSLPSLDTTIPGVAPILTITLTRGAPVYPADNGIKHASASITTLEADVDLDLSVVQQLSKATGVPINLSTLNLPVGLGGALNGPARLVKAQLGNAVAGVSLDSQTYTPFNPPVPHVHINTGNDVLPLSILALALMAAGAGLSIRQARFGRN